MDSVAVSTSTVAQLEEQAASTTHLTSQLTPASPSVDAAAAAVVERVVDDAAFSVALDQEKAKVQHLINGLVTRIITPTTDSVKGTTAASTAAPHTTAPTLDTPTLDTPTRDTSTPAAPTFDAPTPAGAPIPTSAPMPAGAATPVIAATPVVAATAAASPVGAVPPLDYRVRRLPDVALDWTQTRHSVTLNLRVPPWVTKRHVSAHFNASSLTVRINSVKGSGGEPFMTLERSLASPVDPDGCMWALEGDDHGSTLLLELEKASIAWWGTLFQSDDASKYSIIDATASTGGGATTTGAITAASTPVGDSISGDEHAASTTTGATAVATAVANGHSDNDSHDDVDGVVDATQSTQQNTRTSGDVNEAVTSVMESMVRLASNEFKCSGTARRSLGVSATTVEDVEEEENVDEIEAAPAKGGQVGSGVASSTTGRKVLTRADLPKIIEESKAALSKGGAHAAEAAVQLGTFYHYGIGVEQDDGEAARLYRQGLENGSEDASAAFQLGLIYNQGARGVEVDSAQAVHWWVFAARLGNAVAMFNLGVMLMNGCGCEMDPVAAMHWFTEAKKRDAKLEPPVLTRGQMEQRVTMAKRLRKESARRAVAPEERERRKDEALRTVRWLGYTTVGLVGLGVSLVGLRYWMRNRL